ncbi:hypothetical protein [Noviherbaspirillum soli]|uniref:hypothetical protein n=1 Tax=Noviherbaspirillum soli TaxID=1064518 RepID=UPI00188CD446|nr:hypothetical protein [Noviherbaspirillum soli]
MPKQQSFFIYKAKPLPSLFPENSFPDAMRFYKAALFRETVLHKIVKNCAPDACKSCTTHASDAG